MSTQPRTGFADVPFDLLWNGNENTMAGWEQDEYTNTVHIPGSDRNETFYVGSGPLTRAFRVLFDDRAGYESLHALKRTAGVLRIPATLNDLTVGFEVDLSGSIFAEISDVVLMGLSDVRIWIDGEIEATALFQLASRT